MPVRGSDRLCWITGAAGLIGHALLKSPHCPPGWQPRGVTRAEVDLRDFRAVTAAFQQERPGAVIHCAALSKSPACQADPALAQLLNVAVTRHLATLAAGLPFIFFSTDLGFDGRQGNYVETDPLNPLSYYAETKAAAEQIILANPLHMVLRTSLNHGDSPTGDRAFNEETVRTWRSGRVTRLFTDEFRCPIPAVVTARATWELLAAEVSGLFHLAGATRHSRWEIGQLLAARHPEIPPLVLPTSLAEYRGAPRSPDTSLNSARVQARLSFPLPDYAEWLATQSR